MRVMAVYRYLSSAFKDLWSLGSKVRLLGSEDDPGSLPELMTLSP